MKLIDLIQRKPVPGPWLEGENIPWNDPGFSERMLREHLTQDHDLASRKFDRINQHVNWIHHEILCEKPAKILDLCCGPGLYANNFAGLGHKCIGIDYSPASIAYAKNNASKGKLDCTFIEADIRVAEYGEGYDATMLIYGELNVFRMPDARMILKKTYTALKPGGRLILEPHTYECVRDLGERQSSWYTSDSGLFNPSPHIVMEESFWDQDQAVTTNRYFIIDAKTSEVVQHAQSLQAYSHQEYKVLLEECGYTNISFHPSLSGTHDPKQSHLMVILAEKSMEKTGRRKNV
jgi:ubiquinone/menaquinone biosynthesis C-methylase UbiE